MDFQNLNPRVYSIGTFEKLNRTDVGISYFSKIVYLISGELSYTVGEEKRERMSVGNLLYVPAGVKHSFKSKYMRAVVISFDLFGKAEPAVSAATVAEGDFDPALCHSYDECSPFDKVMLIKDMESERDALIRMSNVFASEEGLFRAEISARVKLLLLKIAEHGDDKALPASMVENLDSYIRENIHDEISNTELGAIFGYHPFYISRMLKDRRGITLHQYVIGYRMKLATNMLEKTDRTVAEIADATGFTDASYFTKIFKAEYGITPKEYRNKLKDNFI